ncbi:MAG: hypothetical protein V7K55_03665 [Nostoc sp.]|uniref:hypothetical protein n=1 Tax=Nostoc sp. TaxID=1180 RepID=UPI002FFB5F79
MTFAERAGGITTEAQRSQCVGRVPRLVATGATQREERNVMLLMSRQMYKSQALALPAWGSSSCNK